ncbi:MAG: PEP-CTERM sorting domain-containing protein [Gammaproteobacteria bacterium]|nr:PEP-CTERM sorting domain-containing protein [Gammaproteobacteria bacterium]
MRKLITIFSALALLAPGAAFAVVLSFSDPTGDSTGAVDVIGMDLDINETTGAYEATIRAAAAAPFVGAFRINLNIWNVSLDEFFQDTFNDYNLGAPQTELVLSGTDANLTDWMASHTIVTTTLAGFGNPSGTSFFRSSVADLPFSGTCVAEDIIGFDGCSTSVPAPAPLALILTGAVGLLVRRVRRK